MWQPVKQRKSDSIISESNNSNDIDDNGIIEKDNEDDYNKDFNNLKFFNLIPIHYINIKTLLTTLILILTIYLNLNPFSLIDFNKFEKKSIDNLYNPTYLNDLEDYNIEFYDLKNYNSQHSDGWNYDERILFLVPLRDASAHLPLFIKNLKNITYPHNLIDLAFLVSDTTDSTIKDLKKSLINIQNDVDTNLHFGKINIYEKNFGQIISQSFSDRHGFQAQGPRRKLMAIARNWLLTTALKPYHSWVYWRDIDVETVPATIIEDLMHHNKDVIVPNIWRPLPDWLGNEQPYDLNSWKESEGGLDLADKLDEDAVIVEGYQEYKTWRVHLGYLRDPFGDIETEMELDGIGGVSILTKSKVFQSGAMFPAFSYLKHAETEGFGKLCKTMGYQVIGLPNYVIWHIYEPSVQDLQHMKWMAEEKKNRFKNAKNKRLYNKKWTESFREVDKDWEILKFNVFKNTDLRRYIDLDWNDVDSYLEFYEEPEKNVFPELNNIETDYSVNEINKRYKNGYIPPNEIFNSFPVNNEANKKNKFKFVRFDEMDSINEKINEDLTPIDEKNKLINSNKDVQERVEQERIEQERVENEEFQKQAENDIEESRKEIEAEVQRVEEEHNQEMQKVKEMEMTPEQLEGELSRLREIYEQKKREREERKLMEEAERLSQLAEKRRRKKLLKQKAIQAGKELRRKQAIEKEQKRREGMFQHI